LHGDWGFRGIVMSDWFAVHDTVAPIKAGLDLEMPFPVFRGKQLIAKLEAGKVSEAEIMPALPLFSAACLPYANRLIISLIGLYDPSARYFLRISRN
jgi:hypothetical protein